MLRDVEGLKIQSRAVVVVLRRRGVPPWLVGRFRGSHAMAVEVGHETVIELDPQDQVLDLLEPRKLKRQPQVNRRALPVELSVEVET